MRSHKKLPTSKTILMWLGVLLTFGPLTSALATDMRVSLIARDTTLKPGTPSWIGVKIQIPENTHIYGNNPGALGLPTTVEWILPQGLQASPIYWPATEHFARGLAAGDGYEGTIVLPAELTVSPDTPLTDALSIEAKVTWLACSDSCIPGSIQVSMHIPVRLHAPMVNPLNEDYFQRVDPEPRSGTPWLTLLLAFLGGILLNLMPCVFPVLGIKILSFVEHSKGNQNKIRAHGRMFTYGVVLSFWVLAGILIALRQAGTTLGWGFQLQSPAFISFLMALFFIMALELMGVFEMGLSLTRAGGRISQHNGLTSSFMSGVLATLVATPCTGPFMGVALGVALGHSGAIAWAIFTALALGMASPYWLLSMYPQWIKLLPKPGEWMVSFKQIMAFPLFATVVWLGWVLGLQTSLGTLIQIIFGLLFLAIAVWIWGNWGAIHRKLLTRRCALGSALVVFIIGIGYMGSAIWNFDHKVPLQDSAGASLRDTYNWETWNPERVKLLRAEGKIVFVDFTAAWCLTCQANQQTSLNNRAVVQKLRELGVVAMEADWTRRDPAITEALASFARSGVPLYVIYPANPKRDPIVLPQILTPSIVIDALETAAKN